MKQYLELCRRVIDQGEWVENSRTGKRCLTIINADLETMHSNKKTTADLKDKAKEPLH